MHVLLRAHDRLAAGPAGQAPRRRVFWLLYPLLVTFVIVATANHFIADAFLGACTAAVAAYAARLAGAGASGRLGVQPACRGARPPDGPHRLSPVERRELVRNR